MLRVKQTALLGASEAGTADRETEFGDWHQAETISLEPQPSPGCVPIAYYVAKGYAQSFVKLRKLWSCDRHSIVAFFPTRVSTG